MRRHARVAIRVLLSAAGDRAFFQGPFMRLSGNTRAGIQRHTESYNLR